MLHVLQILRGFEADGPGRLVLELLRALDPGRIRVSLASLRARGPLRREFESEIRRLNGGTIAAEDSLLRLHRIVDKVSGFALDRDVMILHAHLLRADVVGREVATRTGLPYLVTEHGIHSWSEKGVLLRPVVRQWYLHRLYNRTHVAAISASVKRELFGEGFRKSRIHIIPNGIDTELFRPPREDEKRAARRHFGFPVDAGPLLLVMGSLVERKCPSLALRILSNLRRGGHPTAQIVYAGEGPLLPALRREARHLGILGQVHFLGQINEPEQLIRASDLLVHPAIREPFGLVVAEALASGVPVLTRRNNGADELLPPEFSIGIVEGGDPAAWARSCSRLYETFNANPGAHVAMLRAHALARFSRERMAKRYLALYSEIIHTEESP